MASITVSVVSFPGIIVQPNVSITEQGQEVYTYTALERDGDKLPLIDKQCMFNLTDLVGEVVVLQIGKMADGSPLPADRFKDAFTIGLRMVEAYPEMDGEKAVPIQTMSGVKSGTSYCIRESSLDKLVLSLGLSRKTDGPRFAAYMGLWFSDINSEGYTAPAQYQDAEHGEDGNCIVDDTIVDVSGQFRLGGLVNGLPAVAGKGTQWKNKAMRFDPRVALFNDTQIKLKPHGLDEFFVFPTPVEDVERRQPASWLWAELLDDCPEVWQILESRVRHATRKQVEQLTGDRAKLLVRQGQLRITRDGLCPVTRNVFSALRSNMQYCVELEERLGRMYIRTLTQTVVPSAGVRVRSMLACQHDGLGTEACTFDKAKVFGYRMPLMGMENIVPLPKNLRKALVHPDVMAQADGDSDGDTFGVQDDPEIVDMMREHHIDFEVAHKVTKVKAKGPISRTDLIALAIRGHRDANLVGQLTMLMHQFLWITPDKERAAMAGLLAKMAPMTIKNNVMIDGVPFYTAALRFISAWAAEKALAKAAGEPLPTAQWREMQKEAHMCKSPRELAEMRIDKPMCLMDRCWNWMADEVGLWHAKTEPEPLDLVKTAVTAYLAHPGIIIDNDDVKQFKVARNTWAVYWAEWHTAGKPDRDHGPIYDIVEKLGRRASIGARIKALEWVPSKENVSGIAFKLCFLGDTCEDVLGFHPEVKAWIDRKLGVAE